VIEFDDCRPPDEETVAAILAALSALEGASQPAPPDPAPSRWAEAGRREAHASRVRLFTPPRRPSK